MFGSSRAAVKGKNLNPHGIRLVRLSHDTDVKPMIPILINPWCNPLTTTLLLFVCVCTCVFLMSVKTSSENTRLLTCRCREFFNLLTRWYLVRDLGLRKRCVLPDHRQIVNFLTGMEEVMRASFSSGSVVAFVIIATLSYLWIFRWRQRHRIEPKEWPIIGGALETIQHFDVMHDWILSYFNKGLKTFHVKYPGITYTYTIDPNNIEYILKTNFANFPKVKFKNITSWGIRQAEENDG